MISEDTPVKLSIIFAIASVVGGLASAAVSYAVTAATVSVKLETVQTRMDYDTTARDSILKTVNQTQVDVAEIKGMLSEIRRKYDR